MSFRPGRVVHSSRNSKPQRDLQIVIVPRKPIRAVCLNDYRSAFADLRHFQNIWASVERGHATRIGLVVTAGADGYIVSTKKKDKRMSRLVTLAGDAFSCPCVSFAEPTDRGGKVRIRSCEHTAAVAAFILGAEVAQV